jgi:hypothetical protein
VSDARSLTIDELKELAHRQVQSLCQHVLPNGRENCGYWEVGSIEGEPGQSLKVNLRGAMRGIWTDFSAPAKTPERGGNMIQLVALVMFGGNIGEAIKWTKSWLNLDHLDPDRLARHKAQARKSAARQEEGQRNKAELNRRKAHQLYIAAVPAGGTPAEAYLKSRGIDLAARQMKFPGSIRFHPEVYCAEVGKPLPAMVACIYGMDGGYRGTHRTWLQPDGSGKAALVEAKKSLGKYLGGYIQLWKGTHHCPLKDLPRGTPIYVSEGIEDGLSAAVLRPTFRVLAAVSLSNLGALELPADCPVHILAQRDEKQQAIDAFEKAVAALQGRGHEVFLLYPPDGVKDWNDALRREQAALVGEG